MTKITLSSICNKLYTSEIQNALKKTSSNSDIISFSLGMPSEELLPLEMYQHSLLKVLDKNCLQYSSPSYKLRKQITLLMRKRGIYCAPEQIFLTSGAQQAMMLIIRLLLDEDDSIIVDSATYPGLIQIAESFKVNLIPMDISANLRSYLEYTQKKPKLIYTMSEGHNPCGTSLDAKACIDLINTAEKFSIPIIEDDAYGFLNYDTAEYSLKYYSNDLVFYIGSFSKILSPATRVGWIIAPDDLIEKLAILKESSDINMSTLSQHIIYTYLETNNFDQHLQYIKKFYKQKRDIMIEALQRYVPDIKFTIPKSGFFIWCEFPNYIDTNKLFKCATEDFGVSFLPGCAFTSVPHNKSLNNYLRLSFGHCNANLIPEGIKRLGQVVQAMRKQLKGIANII